MFKNLIKYLTKVRNLKNLNNHLINLEKLLLYYHKQIRDAVNFEKRTDFHIRQNRRFYDSCAGRFYELKLVVVSLNNVDELTHSEWKSVSDSLHKLEDDILKSIQSY